MPPPPAPDVTQLLLAWRNGDHAALDRLVPFVYTELHRLAHRHMLGERHAQPLQTTALVNEAYLRLVGSERVRWQNRGHFYAVAAQLMRRILVDAARSRGSRKRGGNVFHLALEDAPEPWKQPDPDLVALDEALKKLSGVDARKCQVVELRYFGGLSVEETAEALAVSTQTVLRDWSIAKAFLLKELKQGYAGKPADSP
ncbi:MAG: sigma-70 family RNA polymerase sigma factor [Bacteroidales bacterium]